MMTGSGLQYKVLREGQGRKPSEFGEVEVHYKGSLLDGTVFDSSYESGEPITFFLSQVIPGWTEGVQLMEEGAHYEFYIPFELAYGAQGIPGDIPPYSTLIFEVELLKVYS
jgi:FKBP-type peptidyl-prolyl cis-trans isomerase FkpA/FKBP-type peptidyl-prolyl cis-trans isomerase FklB